MGRSIASWLLLLALAGLGPACATQAYPGDERPLSEVARVEGAGISESLRPAQSVIIDTIDGEDWPDYVAVADVLPGAHRIDVKLETSAFVEDGGEATRGTLLVDLEAGRTYVLYMIWEPLEYLLAAYPPGERPSWPEQDWDPPGHAVVCTPTAEGPRVLRCPRAENAPVVPKATAGAPRPPDCSVTWLTRDEPVPAGAVDVGDISYNESGAWRVCDEPRGREKVRERACELGADAVRVLALRQPDFSTVCVRIRVQALRFEGDAP